MRRSEELSKLTPVQAQVLELKQLIRQIRRDAGISQADFGKELGDKSQDWVSRYVESDTRYRAPEDWTFQQTVTVLVGMLQTKGKQDPRLVTALAIATRLDPILTSSEEQGVRVDLDEALKQFEDSLKGDDRAASEEALVKLVATLYDAPVANGRPTDETEDPELAGQRVKRMLRQLQVLRANSLVLSLPVKRNRFVQEASKVLPAIKAKGIGYVVYRAIAHDARRCVQDLALEDRARYLFSLADELGWSSIHMEGRGRTNSKHQQPDLKDWAKLEAERSRAMVGVRTRLAHLRWPSPYQEGWFTFTSKPFYAKYCPSESYNGHIAEPRLDDSYGQDLDARETAETSGGNAKYQSVSMADDPGIPEHQCFGDHFFLLDREESSLAKLHNLKCRWEPDPRVLSHRVQYVVPRFLVRLMDLGAIAYQGKVLVTDVAPTTVKQTLSLRPMDYFGSLVGTYSVAVDCYGGDGRREYNGLNLVEEDGRWLLLRSNHASKALFVSILLITADSEVAITLGTTNALENHIVWTPTAMGFMIPEDLKGARQEAIESDKGKEAPPESLVEAVGKAAKRILLQRIPILAEAPTDDESNVSDEKPKVPDCVPTLSEAEQALKVTVVGTALDAALGQQPCFFAIARTSLTSAEVGGFFESQGAPLRMHNLIRDNPRISFSEMFGQARYRNCEMLRLNAFFCWRFFSQLKLKDSDAPLDRIGLSGDSLKEAIGG